MIRPSLPAAACLALSAALLAACSAPSQQSRATAAQQTACRQRADEVYFKQNRAELYRADQFVSSTRDAPFASSGLPSNTSGGLSGRFARDQILSDCLNGLNTSPGPSPDAATPATPASANPPAAPAAPRATPASTGTSTGATPTGAMPARNPAGRALPPPAP